MPKSAKTVYSIKHAHDRAAALGYAAAKGGTPNPYARGSQCWIVFEKSKEDALQSKLLK